MSVRSCRSVSAGTRAPVGSAAKGTAAADGLVVTGPSQPPDIHLVHRVAAYAQPIASVPAPQLGSPESERGWLDLFYDLVFVAAILILSSAFSHAEHFTDGLWVVAAFVAVWWVWLATTLHANRFPEDTVGYRFVVARADVPRRARRHRRQRRRASECRVRLGLLRAADV